MPPAPGSRDHSHPAPELSERSRRILAALVREYIERGEAVSSLWLARHGGFALSSATVRHEMAKLEEAGYVCQPHTSAGRVPTDLGYRCYVDMLLRARRRPRRAPEVEARLSQGGTVDHVLSNVSHELSRVSHHLGFALAVAHEVALFQHIDFVAMDGSKILVVLIAAGGQISQKVVDLGESLAPADLSQAANYLNTEFSGLPLWEVRAAVEQRLRQERLLYDALLSRALRLANSTLDDIAPQNMLFIQGACLLLDEVSEAGDRASLSTLRALFAMIEEKHRLVQLLNHYIDGPGLTIVIGTEHTARDLQNFSLIASTYSDGQQTGSIGVIGPRRMRYSRAIAAVDSVSHAVSRVLIRHSGSTPTDYGRRGEIGTA